ncbi:antibiotic biosynthesis monooxygenase [Pontibacillus litoralis]|uniref:ABM domain-containing protein n=1 Tax=Pontibacillus litoralis JSM 072002 TaxID=1385512 RepID=A0A0A5G003_9BACI|nr:antibiotic biosynthesis monooxygenase [Pontibacillus litoralis]KGX84413.1 hypothetical protein N784_13515 [Pontibacillus litoralis JSM 072002]
MFIASNTLQIKKGFGDYIVRRFQKRQGIEEMPGFIELYVTSTRNLEKQDEVMVLTYWENETSFQNWLHSNQFKEAHNNKSPVNKNGERIVLSNQIGLHDVKVHSKSTIEKAG